MNDITLRLLTTIVRYYFLHQADMPRDELARLFNTHLVAEGGFGNVELNWAVVMLVDAGLIAVSQVLNTYSLTPALRAVVLIAYQAGQSEGYAAIEGIANQYKHALRGAVRMEAE